MNNYSVFLAIAGVIYGPILIFTVYMLYRQYVDFIKESDK